jgi:hypothetical protein
MGWTPWRTTRPGTVWSRRSCKTSCESTLQGFGIGVAESLNLSVKARTPFPRATYFDSGACAEWVRDEAARRTPSEVAGRRCPGSRARKPSHWAENRHNRKLAGPWVVGRERGHYFRNIGSDVFADESRSATTIRLWMICSWKFRGMRLLKDVGRFP